MLDGNQSVRVNGAAIGAQSAGYGDEWNLDVTGGSVSLSVDMRVSTPDTVNRGLWGLSLLSSESADGFVSAFGGIGFLGGEIFLSQDGLTTSSASLGTVACNERMNLSLDFDFTTRTFSAALNGVDIATNLGFNPDATGNIVGYGTFGQACSAGTTENANSDNYSIALVGAPVAVPEAGSLPLALGGLLTLAGAGVARRKNAA